MWYIFFHVKCFLYIYYYYMYRPWQRLKFKVRHLLTCYTVCTTTTGQEKSLYKSMLQYKNSVINFVFITCIFGSSLCVQKWWENVVCLRIFLLRGIQGKRKKKKSWSDAVIRRTGHWVATLHLSFSMSLLEPLFK